MAKHPQNQNQEYQGRIETITEEGRLIVVFDNPIKLHHDLGSMKISKISLRYDVMQEHHPEWARNHPYSSALIGNNVPVKQSTLYAIVTKHHQRQLTGNLEAVQNGDSEDARDSDTENQDPDKIDQKDFLKFLNELKE